MLKIEDYNKNEIVGKASLPNRFIRAFKPVLFESGGFPITVEYEQELIRYIDSMHAYSLKRHFDELCKGLTNKEFELLKKTTADIHNLTKELYNEDFLVKAPMLASLFEKRIIDAVSTDKNKKIMEIGGGSGTLGCVLLNDDRKYISTDVTQSFYLIQNRLYEYISKNGVNELVTDELDKNSSCIHVPYWKMWETRYNPIDVDILTSNHALLEMSQNSLRFYLNYFKNAMDRNNGALVFQGGGWRIHQNLVDLINLFDEHGYKLQYFDHHNEVLAFSTTGESLKDEVIKELNILLQNPKTDKIHALGENIISRLDNGKIYYCDELGHKIKNHFDDINKEEKITYSMLINYYDTFNNIKESYDDEFGDYISPQSIQKSKVRKK